MPLRRLRTHREAATHPQRVQVPLENQPINSKKTRREGGTNNEMREDRWAAEIITRTKIWDRETSEVHRPQFSQRAAASAHPQVGTIHGIN
jgi:hypothetical protein